MGSIHTDGFDPWDPFLPVGSTPSIGNYFRKLDLLMGRDCEFKLNRCVPFLIILSIVGPALNQRRVTT